MRNCFAQARRDQRHDSSRYVDRGFNVAPKRNDRGQTPALECLWFETAYRLVNRQLYFSDL